jgi:hypothetical protein
MELFHSEGSQESGSGGYNSPGESTRHEEKSFLDISFEDVLYNPIVNETRVEKHKSKMGIESESDGEEEGIDSEEERELEELDLSEMNPNRLDDLPRSNNITMKVAPYNLKTFTNESGTFSILFAVEQVEQKKRRARHNKSDGVDGEAIESDGNDSDGDEPEKEHTLEELYGDNDHKRKSSKKKPIEEKRKEKADYNEKYMVKIIGDLVGYIASPLVVYELLLKPLKKNKKGIKKILNDVN